MTAGVQTPAPPLGVWIVGPALEARGGIASVLRAYQDAGLLARCVFLCSYEGPGAWRQLSVFVPALARLLAGLCTGRVALLHVHSASRGSFWRKSLLVTLARLFGVPYFFHVHSGELLNHYQQRWPRWQKAWAAYVLRGAARVLVLTPGWQRAFDRGIGGLRCTVLNNPVAVGAQRPPGRPRERLLFLGRLTELKGAWDLLRALPAVLQRHPGTRLVMAGPGDESAARALVRELGLPEGVVQFPGWIDGSAKHDALKAAGVFVLPSHAEGLPIGVLEAMAEGLLVVASDVGGIPELIDAGRSGLLVRPREPAALAAALASAIEDDGAAEAMLKAAFERVQTHSLPVVTATLEALYRDVGGTR